MPSAIRIDNISKSYRIQHNRLRAQYRTLRESLAEAASWPLRRLRGQSNGTSEEFWALKDIRFDIKQGEVVGIIGRNGAGKSTLLKILSRITAPTAGRVELHGRVGSLLEVGTGFHPELTGRENVYLNGSILGMKRREIQRQFDAIVDFSGVEKFLDTPVKRYSSGMYVRLAFAVAAHFEPEILIVDEVLAVGDAEFQRKCLGKMQSIGRTGRTVLFVSHNMNAIVNLTQRAVLLHAGQVIGIGPSRQIVDQYLDVGAESTSVWTVSRDTAGKLAFIESIRCLNDAGKPTPHFAANESITIEIQCCFREQIDAQVAFRLNSDRDGETIFTTAFSDQQNKRSNTFAPGTHVFRCKFPNHLLVPGSYHLLAAINNFKGPQFDLVEHALSFEVIEVGSLRQFDRRLGVITPCLAWEVHQIAPSNSDSDALS